MTAMRRPPGPSGRRIGVVAFVDDKRQSVRQFEFYPRAAAGRRRLLGQCNRRPREIGAHQAGGSQHGERIHHQMPSGCADLVGDRLAQDLCLDGRAVRVQCAFEKTGLGARVFAERDDVVHSSFFGPPPQSCEMRIVAVNDSGAAGLNPQKDLRLGVRDLRHRGEKFKMHRLDGRDDRHMRTHHAHERRDFAGMVHADFEHPVARRLRHAGER